MFASDVSKRLFPRGPNRHEDPEWAEMIQSQVYPHHSDIDWQEYVDWVRLGGGDDHFLEEEEEIPFDNEDVFWFDTIMATHAAAGRTQ